MRTLEELEAHPRPTNFTSACQLGKGSLKNLTLESI